ncbi:hypothetical protein [Nocardia sp. NPDC057668]|uniref:hypothetical protein n=1 Tax=Nocardia sp. NPDC057668 TaxID=3346202 RepID=UPI003671CF7B
MVTDIVASWVLGTAVVLCAVSSLVSLAVSSVAASISSPGEKLAAAVDEARRSAAEDAELYLAGGIWIPLGGAVVGIAAACAGRLLARRGWKGKGVPLFPWPLLALVLQLWCLGRAWA